MPNATATYQMFNSIVEMLKVCGVKVFLSERPKEIPTKTLEFAVVSLPMLIRRPYIGNDDFRYTTRCVIYLYCRAKNDGTPNIDRQTELVRKVFDRFPYKDNICECVNPDVLMRGSDDFGFQVTTVTFTLRTKINSITNL